MVCCQIKPHQPVWLHPPSLFGELFYWSLGYKGPATKHRNLLCPTGDFEAEGAAITRAPSSSLSSPALLRPHPCSRPPPRCPSLSSSPSPDFIWRRRRSSRGGATACRGCAWWTASGGNGPRTHWSAWIRPSPAGTGCHGSRGTGIPQICGGRRRDKKTSKQQKTSRVNYIFCHTVKNCDSSANLQQLCQILKATVFTKLELSFLKHSAALCCWNDNFQRKRNIFYISESLRFVCAYKRSLWQLCTHNKRKTNTFPVFAIVITTTWLLSTLDNRTQKILSQFWNKVDFRLLETWVKSPQ